MTESIFIDTNDNKRTAFAPGPQFFSIEYAVPPGIRDRMLAVQGIVRATQSVLAKLAEYHLPNDQAFKLMEVLWHEVEETVLPFAGESVATKQSGKDTEAPTSVPLDDSYVREASRSSMKRKATPST